MMGGAELARPLGPPKAPPRLDLSRPAALSVYDKNHQVVTTAVTNMDIHDICRAGKTYGFSFYLSRRQAVAKTGAQIIDHWELGYGSQYNVTRKDAWALARISDNLDDTIIDIDKETVKSLDCRNFRSSTRERADLFRRAAKMLQTRPQPFWSFSAQDGALQRQ